MKIPPTTKRVERNTRKEINEKIKDRTIFYISKYKDADYDTLTRRLGELHREWNTERILEANAATLIVTGSVLGITRKQPGWFILSGLVSAFLLQHAVQGWCPPMEIIRRREKRTPHEINNEIIAIKYLRGDFSKENASPVEIYELANKD